MVLGETARRVAPGERVAPEERVARTWAPRAPAVTAAAVVMVKQAATVGVVAVDRRFVC